MIPQLCLPQTAARLPTIPLQRSVCHRCNERFYVFSHSLNRISILRVRTKNIQKINTKRYFRGKFGFFKIGK